VSSFDRRSHIYLFDLTTGKKRLAYGETTEDALEILSTRMSAEEMGEILKDKYRTVKQSELRSLVKELG